MKSTIKSLIAAILLGASSLVGRAQAGDVPKPYVETGLYSDFVSTSGSVINEESRQDLAALSLGKLDFALWQNQFLGEEGISERDYCVGYRVPLTSNVSARVGLEYWDYPNGRFGDHDSVERANLDYSGKLKASLQYTHLNETDATEAGDRVYLKVSKPVTLMEGKVNVSVTPSLGTAWLNNYYGNSDVSQASAGLTVSVSKGGLSLNLSGTSQKSLDSKVEDLNWGAASIGLQF
jgi:hypothetical protein